MLQSHGGFLTALVLGNKEHVLDCGVAVAPVTDWRYYSVYLFLKMYNLKYLSFN